MLMKDQDDTSEHSKGNIDKYIFETMLQQDDRILDLIDKIQLIQGKLDSHSETREILKTTYSSVMMNVTKL